MDVDGAMVPMAWQPINQPIYYSSRIPLVWHHAPHTHNLYNFVQRRVNFDAQEEKPHKIEEKETTQEQPEDPSKPKPKIEAYFVNLKNSKHRRFCIVQQLKDA